MATNNTWGNLTPGTVPSPLALASGNVFIPASQNPAYQNMVANGGYLNSMGNVIYNGTSLPDTGTQSFSMPKVDKTSYSYMPPLTSLNVGNNLMFGDKLNQNTPGIQSLVSGGYATPNQNNTGVTVTRLPVGQATYQQKSPAPTMGTGITSYGLNQAGATGALPTLPGQPDVAYNYSVKPLTPEQKSSMDSSLRHQLQLMVGDKRVPKDLTPYINAVQFGGYTTQDIANHLTELARTGSSNIVSPNVQRWHWIVGGLYNADQNGTPSTGLGDMSGGLNQPPTNGAPSGYNSQFDMSSYAQLPNPTEIPLPGDYTEEQKFASDKYSQQQQLNKQNFDATIASIASSIEKEKQDTTLRLDQEYQKQMASLSRMGALGTSTAADSYLQGLQQQKNKALNDLEAKKNSLIAEAQIAQQTGDWNAYNDMRKGYFEARKNYESESTARWNTRLDSEQKSVNKFNAISSNMLGMIGKQLEAVGLDIKQQDVDNATEKLRNDITEADRRFQFDVAKYGQDTALKQLNASGFAQLSDGSIVPTVELMQYRLKQSKQKSDGSNSIANIPESIQREALNSYIQHTGTIPPANSKQRNDIISYYYSSKFPTAVGPVTSSGEAPTAGPLSNDKSIWESFQTKWDLQRGFYSGLQNALGDTATYDPNATD